MDADLRDWVDALVADGGTRYKDDPVQVLDWLRRAEHLGLIEFVRTASGGLVVENLDPFAELPLFGRDWIRLSDDAEASA
jgi:hypothetical protein